MKRSVLYVLTTVLCGCVAYSDTLCPDTPPETVCLAVATDTLLPDVRRAAGRWNRQCVPVEFAILNDQPQQCVGASWWVLIDYGDCANPAAWGCAGPRPKPTWIKIEHPTYGLMYHELGHVVGCTHDSTDPECNRGFEANVIRRFP